MNTNLKTKIATLAAFAFIATASGFYNPETGRWLSRDPIGEEGGPNVMAFVVNNPVNLRDPFGLDIQGSEDSSNLQITTLVRSYHGSVELGNGSSYINTDDPGRQDASVSRRAASIERKTTGAIFAYIRASTEPRKLSSPSEMQMSTDLNGYVQICGCCPGGKIRMRWTLVANFYAASPTAVGGAHAAHAGIENHKVFASPKQASQIRGGTDLLQLAPYSCKRVPFILGQAWIDHDLTGSGVFSKVEVSASFSCAGN